MENYLFEKMSVPKAYMKLALPVVLSMIVSLVYNMVDTYFIALTGVQELVAGVSLVAPMFTLMIAFGDIFGLGGSSAISRLLGEKKDNEAKKTCAFCIWISLVFGLCIVQSIIIPYTDSRIIRSWQRYIPVCQCLLHMDCDWCSIYHFQHGAKQYPKNRRISSPVNGRINYWFHCKYNL